MARRLPKLSTGPPAPAVGASPPIGCAGAVDRDNGYISSQDDKTFLGIRTDAVQGAREIQVTMNWFEELKRLLPP